MVQVALARYRKRPVRFGSVRFQLKPVPVPPVRFRADVFSGTDVLGDFPGRCFFWYGCFGGFSGPMFFLVRMFWEIFRADVFSGTDVLGRFLGRCFFLDRNLKN